MEAELMALPVNLKRLASNFVPAKFAHPDWTVADGNSRGQIALNFFKPGASICLASERLLLSRARCRRHLRRLAPVHFADVHPTLASLGVLEHQQVGVSLVFGDFVRLA